MLVIISRYDDLVGEATSPLCLYNTVSEVASSSSNSVILFSFLRISFLCHDWIHVLC